MKHFLLSAFGFCFLSAAYAQQIPRLHGEPYFIVDSIATDIKYLVIESDHIKEVTVLKDSNAVKAYGDKARHGAVAITTKPTVRLIRLQEILDKYNVSPADRNLRICINKNLVSKPELILAAEDMITGVEITTERNWINAEDANSTERFINIQTTGKKK
jgi:hypothetical protein